MTDANDTTAVPEDFLPDGPYPESQEPDQQPEDPPSSLPPEEPGHVLQIDGLPQPPDAVGFAPALNLNVPYLHQLWDTPTHFDGRWACGPTSLAMVLAYYQVLPPQPISLSGDAGRGIPPHVSSFGFFISEPFQLRGQDFTQRSPTETGQGAGLYGSVVDVHPGIGWATSPYPSNNVRTGPNARGLLPAVQRLGGPPMQPRILAQKAIPQTQFHAAIVQALQGGSPVIVGGNVFGYGHIIVVKGLVSNGSGPVYIVNDPMGYRLSHRYNGANVGYLYNQINPRWLMAFA